MADHRISVVANGQIRPPLSPQPVLSSASTGWQGFLLEQHYMPPIVEFPSSMRFPGHLVALSICDQPPLIYWREDGHPRTARLFNGRIAVRSSQDLISCRQHGSCTLFSLLIDDSTMERVCEEVPGRREVELIPRPDVPDRALQHLVLAIVEDLRAGCPTGRIFGESVVNAIAAYTAQKYSAFSSRFPEYKDGLPAPCLRRVLDFIHSNLACDLSVAKIARVALISPYHFGRLFKQSTGQTLHQYVLDQRLKKAQSLLATSNVTLVEIASIVGLANQSHFTTAFRKKIGVTPAFYRTHL